MPKVTFEADNLTVEVPEGKPLIEVCQENNASLPFFSCEDGSCGTCLCPIEPIENLDPNPAEGAEKKLLEVYCAKDNERLACQVKVKGDITVKSPY